MCSSSGESKTVIDVNILAMLTSAHLFGNHLSQQGLEVSRVLTVPAASNFVEVLQAAWC